MTSVHVGLLIGALVLGADAGMRFGADGGVRAPRLSTGAPTASPKTDGGTHAHCWHVAGRHPDTQAVLAEGCCWCGEMRELQHVVEPPPPHGALYRSEP